MRLMQSDLAHHWTLGELARHVHLSSSQLIRLFTREVGLPPISYLIALRVREMTRLLRETHHSVRDIARAVGWRNRAHAAEQFFKLTGQTPAECRAETRIRTVAECFWCGQSLPAPDYVRDTRRGGGDPTIQE